MYIFTETGELINLDFIHMLRTQNRIESRDFIVDVIARNENASYVLASFTSTNAANNAIQSIADIIDDHQSQVINMKSVKNIVCDYRSKEDPKPEFQSLPEGTDEDLMDF